MSSARLFLATLATCLSLSAATLNFESLSGGTLVTNQFQASGVSFNGFLTVNSYFSGRVLTVSGTKWLDVANTGSPGSTANITIVDPLGSGTVFYTDSISFQSNGLLQNGHASDFFDGISISALDVQGQQVGSTFSIGAANGTTGRATITVSFTGSIHRLDFTRTANVAGHGAAPMDDLVIGNLYSVADAPEPGTFLLLGASLGLAAFLRRK